MMVRPTHGGNRTSMPIDSHDQFLELCALAASGDLSPSEHKRLSAHLAICAACREAQKQFASLISGPISALAAEEHADRDANPDSSWSIDEAEAALFDRLAREQGEEGSQRQPVSEVSDENFAYRPAQAAMDNTWRQLWISYAAAILLIVSLVFVAYRVGISRTAIDARPKIAATSDSKAEKLEEQISDLSHDRELAIDGVTRRERLIADLKHQVQQQSNELAQLKSTAMRLQQEATVRNNGQDFAQEHAELQPKLQQAEAENQALRGELEAVEQKSAEDKIHVTSLQTRLDDLTRGLQEKEAEIGQQQDLLAHDRDIRELMGARDLYISEVYDVGRSGHTEKPFGRVFYTKEKSLVFYAYDLQQEVGLRNASAFQAWGRRGPDWTKALNLGIFYEDNAAKKRWVLKVSDPRTLEQIDAVFVTVEPDGGSRKPSGKPLLFAYLKMDPNHP